MGIVAIGILLGTVAFCVSYRHPTKQLDEARLSYELIKHKVSSSALTKSFCHGGHQPVPKVTLFGTTFADSAEWKDRKCVWAFVENSMRMTRHSIPPPASPTVWFEGELDIPKFTTSIKHILSAWPILGGRFVHDIAGPKVVVDPLDCSVGFMIVEDLNKDAVKKIVDWDGAGPEPTLSDEDSALMHTRLGPWLDRPSMQLAARGLPLVWFLVFTTAQKGYFGITVAVNHIVADVSVPYHIMNTLDLVYNGDGVKLPPLVTNFGVATAFYEHRQSEPSGDDSTKIQDCMDEAAKGSTAPQLKKKTTKKTHVGDARPGAQKGLLTQKEVADLIAQYMGKCKVTANDVLMSAIAGSRDIKRYHMTVNLRMLAAKTNKSASREPVPLFGYQGVFLDAELPETLPHLDACFIRPHTLAFVKSLSIPSLTYDHVQQKMRGMFGSSSFFLNNWASVQYTPKNNIGFRGSKFLMHLRTPLAITVQGDLTTTSRSLNAIFVMLRKPEVFFWSRYFIPSTREQVSEKYVDLLKCPNCSAPAPNGVNEHELKL
eukprot:TRINITY_DN7353_c0_g1_i1.p1 TRINITY_DN7353_c0_g1~~TRINITY_DN7353_c0_g1_i1.p1  ORF type:complete len:571 (+),score=46.54 TRINITY_DN7353_c0_g1_i1:87-1715(+)